MFCIVLITVPDEKTGQTLATQLVEKRLAACVNRISGVTSVYHWEGKIEEGNEQLLICKTRDNLVQELIAEVKQHHPYSVPEIIALPIIKGSSEYLQWIGAETKGENA